MPRRTLPETFVASPWIDFRDSQSDVLLVTFSSAATQKGKFTPYIAVNDLPYSILRVNTPDRLWYIGGIPETDLQPGRFEAIIDEIILGYGFRRVIFYGGSKGGFGAIDIGLRVKSDIIISTGAETIFGHTNGYARKVVPLLRMEIARRRIDEWPILSQNRTRKIHVLYGWESNVDREFAQVVRRLLAVEPIMLRGCGHSVPEFISKKSKLSTVIADLSANGESAFITQHAMSKSDQNAEMIKALPEREI
jgi:hypothetical protein